MISFVLQQLQSFTHLQPPVLSGSAWLQFSSHSFLTLRRRQKIPKPIRWYMPHVGWKWNIDGSSLGNPGHSGGGMVLRDPTGAVVFADSIYFGHGTSLFAESMALLYGLRRCNDFGFSSVQVETDSQLLVFFLVSHSPWPWQLHSILFEAQCLLSSFPYPLVHIFREANSVADSLARLASSSCASRRFTSASLPRSTRGLVMLDQLGCPYIRYISKL